MEKDGGAATANNGQDSVEDSVDDQEGQPETLAKDPEEEKKPSESANPSQSAEAEEAAGPSASNEPSSSLSWIVNSARAVVDTARNILSINTQETVPSSTNTDEPDSCQTVASSSQEVDQDLDQEDGQDDDDDDDGSVDLEEYQV